MMALLLLLSTTIMIVSQMGSVHAIGNAVISIKAIASPMYTTIAAATANNTNNNLISNPDFAVVKGALPSWNDPFKQCTFVFKCTVNSTTGWNDNTSLQISTNTTKQNTWSYLVGNAIQNVKPNEQYELVTHMKLNKWATQSHIFIEGFNQTSNKWYQIIPCPPGSNGPLDWRAFTCVVKIPANTSKIRPILNAGWSSGKGKEAVTWYDALSLTKKSITQKITAQDNNNNNNNKTMMGFLPSMLKYWRY